MMNRRMQWFIALSIVFSFTVVVCPILQIERSEPTKITRESMVHFETNEYDKKEAEVDQLKNSNDVKNVALADNCSDEKKIEPEEGGCSKCGMSSCIVCAMSFEEALVAGMDEVVYEVLPNEKEQEGEEEEENKEQQDDIKSKKDSYENILKEKDSNSHSNDSHSQMNHCRSNHENNCSGSPLRSYIPPFF